MITNMEKCFEEIAEIYGGFPLKEKFLEAGNVALKKYGVEAKLEEGTILIPFVDRLLYTQEDLDYLCDTDESEEDMKTWRVEIDACIELADDPVQGIQNACYAYEVVTPWEPGEFNDCFDIRGEEYSKAIELIETFLNAAVNVE